MVEKHRPRKVLSLRSFESSVNSYGRKTIINTHKKHMVFESSVNSYGRKTFPRDVSSGSVFESSVNSYGRKTYCVCNTMLA